MKRREMIKDKKVFNNIIQTGSFFKNKFFVIYIKERKDEKIMFGIAISNKTGKAHIRNKIKRKVRAIIDNNKNLFKNNYDYIIMIRKACIESTFTELNDSLVSLLNEVKVKQ